MEEIKAILEDFDPAALIPDLNSVLGRVEMIVRVAILAGPVILLLLGLWYFFLPPKEANHYVGYRFFWSMNSVEVWRFTQRLAGGMWMVLGLVLTVVMLLISGGYRGKECMDIVWSGFYCIVWQIGLVLVSCVFVDGIVLILFNGKGIRRRNNPPRVFVKMHLGKKEAKTPIHMDEKMEEPVLDLPRVTMDETTVLDAQIPEAWEEEPTQVEDGIEE